jgi:hypothetical protein
VVVPRQLPGCASDSDAWGVGFPLKVHTSTDDKRFVDPGFFSLPQSRNTTQELFEQMPRRPAKPKPARVRPPQPVPPRAKAEDSPNAHGRPPPSSPSLHAVMAVPKALASPKKRNRSVPSPRAVGSRNAVTEAVGMQKPSRASPPPGAVHTSVPKGPAKLKSAHGPLVKSARGQAMPPNARPNAPGRLAQRQPTPLRLQAAPPRNAAPKGAAKQLSVARHTTPTGTPPSSLTHATGTPPSSLTHASALKATTLLKLSPVCPQPSGAGTAPSGQAVVSHDAVHKLLPGAHAPTEAAKSQYHEAQLPKPAVQCGPVFLPSVDPLVDRLFCTFPAIVVFLRWLLQWLKPVEFTSPVALAARQLFWGVAAMCATYQLFEQLFRPAVAACHGPRHYIGATLRVIRAALDEFGRPTLSTLPSLIRGDPLGLPESYELELKGGPLADAEIGMASALRHLKGACRYFSAWLNGNRPGRLLIGIHDSGTVQGIRMSSKDQDRFRCAFDEVLLEISPLADIEAVVLSFERVHFSRALPPPPGESGLWIAVLEVRPAWPHHSARPVFCWQAAPGSPGEPYLRRTASTHVMPAAEVKSRKQLAAS